MRERERARAEGEAKRDEDDDEGCIGWTGDEWRGVEAERISDRDAAKRREQQDARDAREALVSRVKL